MIMKKKRRKYLANDGFLLFLPIAFPFGPAKLKESPIGRAVSAEPLRRSRAWQD